VGEEHYNVARGVQQTLQRYKELRDIIAILGMDELARKTNWPWPRPQDPAFPVATVPRCGSVHRRSWQVRYPERHYQGFQGIVNGEYDHLPEQAFYMVGGIEEAVEKARRCNNNLGADHGNDRTCDVVSAEEQIFSGLAEVVVVRARWASWVSIRAIPP